MTKMENKVRQRTMRAKRANRDLKSVPLDEILTSNNKDNSIKIVISNVRLYDEDGRSGKHAMWSLKDLKKGLLWVIDIGVRTGLYEGKYGKRKDEGLKCLD